MNRMVTSRRVKGVDLLETRSERIRSIVVTLRTLSFDIRSTLRQTPVY